MNDTTHSEQFHIAASHPALPGHFPGNPVVPGVVLLDRVAEVIGRVWARRISGFAQVKFQRPLLPEQRAELILERGTGVRFRILAGAETIASGVVELGR
jgi:3-hydroxyacyl-[acyl-carrier-protein] dehydratase